MSHRPLPFRNLLRLGAAALIPQMLKEQGISEEAGFWRTWFNRRTLAQPDPIVPVTWLGGLFRSAAAASAQPEFGLLLGLQAGSRLAEWGQAPMPSDTQVGAALMRIISRPAIFPNAFLGLNISSDTCTVGCIALPHSLIARDQLTDCAIGFAAGALRALCGPRWQPLCFRFAHGPPVDPSRHAALLQAPIAFNASATAMEFGSAWLDSDCVSPQGRNFGDAYKRRLHRDLVGEVRETLASWKPIGKPSATAVASALGLQPRTLSRLLGKTGTNFNRMLEEARYETAQRMLRDPVAPVASIGWSLGYVDAAAFSRAFRRWSGMTPTKWRKETGSGAP